MRTRHTTTAMLLPLLAACQGSPVIMPQSPHSISGQVTALDRAGERIGSIRVEAVPTDSSGSPKASVRVTQGTEVLERGRRVDFGALRPGQHVRVWFTGPVRESYPVQADAATVVIDSAGTPR